MEVQTPGAGEYVLPTEVQIMLKFVRTVKTDSFRFSREIRADWRIQQRLVEGAYPMRFADNARYYVYMEHEVLPEECQMMMHQRGFALAG
jgi:hypothetical protein